VDADLERFLTDSGAELRFLQHRETDTVHIVAPPTVGPAREFRFGEISGEDALDIALGVVRTLCQYVGRQNIGDDLIISFADDDLCRRCYRALGPYSARAFEHPRPGVDDD
jgi:hypothetical protein